VIVTGRSSLAARASRLVIESPAVWTLQWLDPACKRVAYRASLSDEQDRLDHQVSAKRTDGTAELSTLC